MKSDMVVTMVDEMDIGTPQKYNYSNAIVNYVGQTTCKTVKKLLDN